MQTRLWWTRLLSEEQAGGDAPSAANVFADGEAPAGGAAAGGNDTDDQDDANPDAADAGDLGADIAKAIEADDAADLLDETEDQNGQDDDDVEDLLATDSDDKTADDTGDDTGDDKGDDKAEADQKPDAKAADAKAEPKDPATGAYADLDPFTFVEKAPKVSAKDLGDIDGLLKAIDQDIESQVLSPEGAGKAIKAVVGIVHRLVTRAEMTDAMLTRDVAASKAMEEQQTKARAETIDETLDRVAGPIAGENRIGRKGKAQGSQVFARQELLAKANEIAQRHAAKGGDPKAVTLDRVIKAAAIALYGKTRAATPPSTPQASTPPAAPSKKPLSAKPAAKSAQPTAPPAPPSRPRRPGNFGDAEDAVLGIRS